MRLQLRFAIVTILLLCTGLCQAQKARQLLIDPQFSRGFALSRIWADKIVPNPDTLRFTSSNEPPKWLLAQWATNHSLQGARLTRTAEGLTFRNEAKRVSLNPADGTLTLEIMAGREYHGPRRSASEPWVHLLIEQSMDSGFRIADFAGITVGFSLRLLYCTSFMSGDMFNPGLHTAQSPFYLFLRNTNPNSPDHNKCLWFGIPSYDWRDKRLTDEAAISWDVGTNMYIYAMPPRTVWGDILFTDHQWHTCNIDLKPCLEKAIADMRSHNQFLHSTPDDFSIASMNFGWEIPGIFDAAVQIKNLSIAGVSK